jgi:hypothetical protein
MSEARSRRVIRCDWSATVPVAFFAVEGLAVFNRQSAVSPGTSLVLPF